MIGDKEELFNILSSLVKINSENFGKYGNEAECSEYIAKFYEGLGYKGEVYSPFEIENIKNHPDYFDGRNLENRKNVAVVVLGKKRDKRLMVASHVDTVEICLLTGLNHLKKDERLSLKQFLILREALLRQDRCE